MKETCYRQIITRTFDTRFGTFLSASCACIPNGRLPACLVAGTADTEFLGNCDEGPCRSRGAAFLAPGVPEVRPNRPRRTGRKGRAARQGRAAHGYAPGNEARELRGGVELVMRFDQGAERFTGVDSGRYGCARDENRDGSM